MHSNLTAELLLGGAPLILSLSAILILMLDVFLKRDWSRGTIAGLSLIAAFLLLYVQSPNFTNGRTIFAGFIFADSFSLYFSILITLGALLSLMLGISKLKSEGIDASAEYYALFLISTAGAMLFASSAEFIMLFLALEIMSMALYSMCGSALGLRRSSEAAMKYFFLGSFSSAFLLYGIAILYGLTGTTVISEVHNSLGTLHTPMALIAIGLVLIGLVFKVGAVPFHFWAPDVYEGAPTPVTAFMACVIKASAVAAALRVLWGGFGQFITEWSGAVWTIAALTMIVGNLIALRQRSLKRMLAYSSIAHAGYLVMAFLAPGTQYGGGAAALYYLVAYTVMTLGAFGVLLAVTSQFSDKPYPDDISRFNGLSSTRPYMAVLMSLFLLSLAGIPPGMAGLIGKFYVFSAAVKAGYVGLAVIGVIGSAISCYYYLRVIVAMYFIEAKESETAQPYESAKLSLEGALAVCASGVIALGLFPSWLYELAQKAISSL